jgi:hypothetical protein
MNSTTANIPLSPKKCDITRYADITITEVERSNMSSPRNGFNLIAQLYISPIL